MAPLAAARASSIASSLRAAAASLFQRHLLLTNVAISVGLSAAGDLLQQRQEAASGERHKDADSASKPPSSDARSGLSRAAHMGAAFGLTSGVLCHHWYLYLDRAVPGSGLRVVTRKVLLDQLLFSPVCIAACLGASGVLEGGSLARIREELAHKGLRLYLAEWVIWPPAQFVNFHFLPTRFRVLFDNLVSLGYDVYASRVKHQTPPRSAAFSAFSR